MDIFIFRNSRIQRQRLFPIISFSNLSVKIIPTYFSEFCLKSMDSLFTYLKRYFLSTSDLKMIVFKIMLKIQDFYGIETIKTIMSFLKLPIVMSKLSHFVLFWLKITHCLLSIASLSCGALYIGEIGRSIKICHSRTSA